jgi:hypothetical protein
MTTVSIPRLPLPQPHIRCDYLAEPSLLFCGGREHVSARIGIATFGPRSLDMPQRHPDITRVGTIGSGRSQESAYQWVMSCLQGVEGNSEHDAFPGYAEHRGFYTSLRFSNQWNETITQNDLRAVAQPRLRRDRFTTALEVVSDKLRSLAHQDSPPDYVILALPDDLLIHCETVDYIEDKHDVHRDFRRALKAEAMQHHLPTQILRQQTSEAAPDSKEVDHKSRVAWNFFSSMYFKTGGIPWSPKGLMAGTCYVGISFYRPLGSASTVCASVAQAFNEYGDGMVLRGQDFQWDTQAQGRSPHLDRDQARTLIDLVLKQYKEIMKSLPQRVVVHKSSRFWPAEEEGFQDALSNVPLYDLVAIRPTNRIRLLREGRYPPLRGTAFTVDDVRYLYTTGFIPALKAYPHGHVPSPLQIADYIGDNSFTTIQEEILLLTKMNWNTTAFADVRPITLRFSQLVGDIMREIPTSRVPLPQFKYYM